MDQIHFVRMYGVPVDLPLAPFVGHELNQITLGHHQTQLHFDCGSISIEGSWELRDAGGTVIDQRQEHAARDCYRIHRIISLPVTRFEIAAPTSFTLVFEPGYRLTIFDDNPQYASFSVTVVGRPSVFV